METPRWEVVTAINSRHLSSRWSSGFISSLRAGMSRPICLKVMMS